MQRQAAEPAAVEATPAAVPAEPAPAAAAAAAPFSLLGATQELINGRAGECLEGLAELCGGLVCWRMLSAALRRRLD